LKYKEKNNETNFDIFKVDASDSALKIWDKDNSVEVIWSQTIKQPPSNFSFLDDLLPFREEPAKTSAVIRISFPISPAKLFSIYYPEIEACPSGLLVIAKEEIPKDILEEYKSIFYPNVTDESALNFASKAFEKWAIYACFRTKNCTEELYKFLRALITMILVKIFHHHGEKNTSDFIKNYLRN